MSFTDYLGIIASVATLVSISANIIQWRGRRALKAALRARSQAAYNYFYGIAYRADAIRELSEKLPATPDEGLQFAIRQAYAITGTVDAARNDVIAYCREHLDMVPVEEHPATPVAGRLPKPGLRSSVETLTKDYPRWGAPGKRT
jgi:hypothetical protein